MPSSLREEMRQKIHLGHLGIEKCKARARSILYWPGMINETVDVVSNCGVCMETRNYQAREKLISHDVPSNPCEKVGTELFQLKGKDYLTDVDYTVGVKRMSPVDTELLFIIYATLSLCIATQIFFSMEIK